jgi:predicted transposase YdaD
LELYQRGWDKQRVIDLFSVMDWMMRLPEQLKRSLWHNIEVLEEQEKMRYVTSVEQLYNEKWMQQGLQQGMQQGLQQGMQQGLMQGRIEGEQRGIIKGEAYALQRLLQKRFGPLSEDLLARLQTARVDELELWLDRALDADTLAGVFAQ